MCFFFLRSIVRKVDSCEESHISDRVKRSDYLKQCWISDTAKPHRPPLAVSLQCNRHRWLKITKKLVFEPIWKTW